MPRAAADALMIRHMPFRCRRCLYYDVMRVAALPPLLMLRQRCQRCCRAAMPLTPRELLLRYCYAAAVFFAAAAYFLTPLRDAVFRLCVTADVCHTRAAVTPADTDITFSDDAMLTIAPHC